MLYLWSRKLLPFSDRLRFKLFHLKVPAVSKSHVNINSNLLHLTQVFAVISSKVSNVWTVKKAGSKMEHGAIISPPIM